MLLSPCSRPGREEQSGIGNNLHGLHNNGPSNNDSFRINNSTYNQQYTTASISEGEQRREQFNRPLNLDLLSHTSFCSASDQASVNGNNVNKVNISSSIVNKGASRIASSVNFANDLNDEFGASSSTQSGSFGPELANASVKLRHRLRDKSSALLSSDRPSSACRVQPQNSAILARRHSSVSPQSSSNPLPFRRNTMSYCSQVSAISLSSTKLTLDNLLDNVISSVQTKLNGTDVSSETQPLLFNSNNNNNTNTSNGINSSSSVCMNQTNLNNNANCYYTANANASNSTTTANNNSTAANKPSCSAKANGAMSSNTNAVLNNTTGNEDFIQAGDFLKYKVKLRDATMHQEDLLDPELVQVQTFKKARPESGWASILLNAAIRVAFIPFLYSWWRTEVSRMQYAMLLGAWFMASWNLKRYCMSQLPVVSNSKFSVYELELLCPSFYLFLLTFTYCHIHNARKRTPASNNSSGYSTGNAVLHNVSTSPNVSRDVEKGSRKGVKQVFPRRASRRHPLRSSILTQTVPSGNNRALVDRSLGSIGPRLQSNLPVEATSSSRLPVIPMRAGVQFRGPNLSPINDQEREENDVESLTNNEDRQSVSSLEEHVQTNDNAAGDMNPTRGNTASIPNLDLGQNQFVRINNTERGSYDESTFESINRRDDLSTEDTNTTVSRASPASQLLDLESSRDENDLTAVESDPISRLFVATQSTSLDMSLEQGAAGIDMPGTSNAPDLDDNQKSKESSGDAVDFLEAMVQSSVSVFHMSPCNNSSGPLSSVNNSGLTARRENWAITGVNPEEATFSDDLSTHAEMGTSVEVTTAELDSETPPWTSRQQSTQSSSTFESKQNQQLLHSTVKQSLSVPLEGFYGHSANSSDHSANFHTTKQTIPECSGSSTLHDQAQASDINTESDIPLLANISLPLESLDYGSQPRSISTSNVTIGRNRSHRNSVSTVVRLGPSKVTITPSRKRQSSLSSVNSRSSFLHKSIVKYLGDLEQKAREASVKENNARRRFKQLSLRDKFLRFLMTCKLKLFGELIESQKSILASPVSPSSIRKTSAGQTPGDDMTLGQSRPGVGSDDNSRLENESPSMESEEEEENDHGNILEESEEEEDEDVNDGEGQEEETGGSSIEEVEEQNENANVNVNGDNFSTTSYDHYPGADEASHHMYNRATNSTSTGPAGTSISQTPEKTVKIITWNQMGKCNKANLTAEQVVDMIVTRADSIRNSNFYLAFGVFCAAFISGLPFIYRYFAIRDFIMFEDIVQLITAANLENIAATNFITMETYLSYFCALSSFMTCTVFFLLLAAAERTYLQRYYYSKYLYRLTSSRKARKCEIPHFRLTKVRNIKMWLYIRFKLKAHGPQKTVEVIVSNCLLFCILSISCFCFKLLEQHSSSNDSSPHTSLSSSTQGSPDSTANSPSTSPSGGSSSEGKIAYPNLASWIAIFWCLALGSLLLRFITIGTKVNKKYSNTAMLTTERINLSLRMENKPEKREEYFLADRVLKLACRLISEVESPFKVSGLVMNSALYNIMRVIVLSAVSAVMSEILGFKLKLWKI